MSTTSWAFYFLLALIMQQGLFLPGYTNTQITGGRKEALRLYEVEKAPQTNLTPKLVAG